MYNDSDSFCDRCFKQTRGQRRISKIHSTSRRRIERNHQPSPALSGLTAHRAAALKRNALFVNMVS
jgi:hypothetical protein